ncbi:hypothetical protein [Streptomyces zhihengii]|uniref:hypothetical protein n=1 Tax=Streptomyces zhihengii TaxID=1818004 RepID=UPI003611A607
MASSRVFFGYPSELREGDTLDFSAALTATSTTTPIHVMIVIATTGPTGRPREEVAFVRRVIAESGQDLRLAKAHPLRRRHAGRPPPAPTSSPFRSTAAASPRSAFQPSITRSGRRRPP